MTAEREAYDRLLIEWDRHQATLPDMLNDAIKDQLDYLWRLVEESERGQPREGGSGR